MTGFYGPIYAPNLYGDVLYTRPEEQPPPEQPAEVDEPLQRDRIAIGSAGYPSFCDGMPPLTLALLRDMRDDPMIEFAYFLAVAPIFAGNRTLQIRQQDGEDAPSRKTMPGMPGVAVGDGPEDKFKRAAERVFEDQWPDILQGLECVNFGHWTQEVSWDRREGLIAPVRFNSFRPWEIVLVPDVYNDFAGFKLGSEERDARYAFHAICDEHLAPLVGRPRARAAFRPWWRQTKSHDNADRIERKASGIQMMIGIMSGMTFKDADGNLVSAEKAVQTVKDAAVSGKTWTRPLFAFTKEQVAARPELASVPSMVVDKFDWGETGPALLANIARLERLDKEIVRAYHRPEREAMEGQHGTKAEAGVQGQIGVTDSELLHADLLTQFNEQTFNRFLVTNKGPDAAGSMYWKPTPLADSARQWKETLAAALVASPVDGPETTRHIDKRELLKTLETPLLEPQDVPPAPVMPTAADAQPQDAAAQGNGVDPLANRMNGNGRAVGLSADPFDGAGALALADCGTGAGGFKAGNTCAKGGGTGTQTLPDLSDDEKAAVKSYSLSGYQVLNQKLRDGETLTPKEQRTAELLDSAIEKAGVRDEPLKVYRGIEVPQPPGPSVGLSEDDIRNKVADFAEKRYPVGKEITLGPNYQSASLDVQAPLDHSISRTHPGIIFEIQARTGLDASSLSGFDDEDEFLMGRDRRFRVLGVTRYAEFDRPDDRIAKRTVVRLEELL